MRVLFGPGAIGETVRQIQRVLTASGFTLACDGCYGPATVECVKAYQQSNVLPGTGVLDDSTWQLLMQRPVPRLSERCLQLTAAFEGHGFDHVVGNFDGALLTWGIIGFTLASGGIQSIVQAVHQTDPDAVQRTFSDRSDELFALINASREWQTRWATGHTQKNGALSEPWRSLFAAFGSLPEVQREQLKIVETKYWGPAISTAQRLSLHSELGLALCFDIHVQNGGIRQQTLEQLRTQSAASTSELDLRIMIANAVADHARGPWRDDVRCRKLTIATGEGTVHGRHYVLANWGLSGEFAAPELSMAAARPA